MEYINIPVVTCRLVKEKNRRYQRKVLRSSVDVSELLKSELSSFDREAFIVISLDIKFHITNISYVSIGNVSQTALNASNVFKPALLSNASSVIVAHNHPSGDPNPSPADVSATDMLVKAGKILGIKVMDHLIIGDTVFSFYENGLMQGM